MPPIPAILVFDVGKTNKKVLLLDEAYQPIFEESRNIEEIKDEDGFACDDIDAIKYWLLSSLQKILKEPRFEIRGINFSAYGASFVMIDEKGNVNAPLYNYLKPYPESLQQKFYSSYGGKTKLAIETASPVLGSLNSGLQLYRLKNEKPSSFQSTRYALHLPQYLSYLITKQCYSDLTSIGCHTQLWNFNQQAYHRWVKEERIEEKLAPISPSVAVHHIAIENRQVPVGIGLHDSSAALIPYLENFKEPFVLLSTGTWCIALNPFNREAITEEALEQDCLCYLTHRGEQVKASRLFAGYEHEQQVNRLAEHFHVKAEFYKLVAFDKDIVVNLSGENESNPVVKTGTHPSAFGKRDLHSFRNIQSAYHQLMIDIMQQQVQALSLVMNDKSVSRVFVDGGFGNNQLYMQLLAMAYPSLEVCAARVAQASAVGAALAIHPQWNNNPIPGSLISLRSFPGAG